MKSIGIWLGILSGTIGIASYLILYYIDPILLFKWLRLIGFLVVFCCMVITAIVHKRNAPPQPSFRMLIRPVFTVFVVFMLMVCICQYIMFNIVDPSLFEQFRAWNLERIPVYMENIGDTPENIAKAKEDWQLDLQSGWRELVQLFFFNQIPGFFFALIITALSYLIPSKHLTPINH